MKIQEPRWLSGSASDSYHKGHGFDSRSREKTGTTETRIFHVLTFTVVSVVRNPLETVGPVVGTVASSNYLIGFANKQIHSLGV